MQMVGEGRSINLALSHRGWAALNQAGIADVVQEIAIPMRGRMIHSEKGGTQLQPYSIKDENIYSVSRFALNNILISQAEKKGAKFYFEHSCEEIQLEENRFVVKHASDTKTLRSDLLIGADGAFSALRSHLQRTARFNYSQYYIEHAYKELTIPPTAAGDFAMEPNALHIWPRGGFMLIALPNLDKSFTCTLFYPYEGPQSFANLQTPEHLQSFFKEYFPDALALMPKLAEEFFTNPTSDLITVRCFPWTYNGKQVLLGDAAHAIVPFYGQGMNAAFEDCRILTDMLEEEEKIADIIYRFQQNRKPDADAIAELALQNFVEMRDLVADKAFVERKKVEKELYRRFPDNWEPLYNMVTFSHRPYSEALQQGILQDSIMKEVMKKYENAEQLNNKDYESIIAMLKQRQP